MSLQPMRFVAVLNRDGGTLRTMDLDAFCEQARSVFEAHGHDLDCRVVAGSDVESTLKSVAESGSADAIIAAGGDGTISSAGAIAFETGIPLAVLPCGTMNLFARALGVPLDLNEALEAIAGGQIAHVDIATANGRPFVHQFGVGVHARLVRIREQMSYGSRVGKMMASLRAIGAAALDPPQFEADLKSAKGVERRVVSGIAVSNNPLGEKELHALHLDSGVLGIYIAAAVNTSDLLRLAADVLLGRWRASPFVSEKETSEVTLSFPKRKHNAKAVIDGELVDLDRTVRLKVHPRALAVVIPVASEAVEIDATTP